ncbi:LamG-like jellyroll fold domain-containing protein [Wenyingzhuangia sp. IMCC45467]
MTIPRFYQIHSLKSIIKLILIISCSLFLLDGYGQTASISDNIIAQPTADRVVLFDVTDSGISKTIQFGADLAWPSRENFRRALLFMGKDQTDVARVSFQPTHPLVDGDLQQEQIDALNFRLGIVEAYASPDVKIVMNSDAISVDPYFLGNAVNWKNLLKANAKRIEDRGFPVISIGPMNEPDLGPEQGSIQDFYDIVVEMKNDPYFDGKRISGGNTLNTDKALEWYDFLKPSGINEGNTHQLAGSFDNYANFFEQVRANGDYASNDELHNVMEALVGYEYGMQMGIWWGPANYARGEMVKAFDGERIGYAEHRSKWTAAAVYRTPDGKVQAFGGTSERQANTTSFKYVSKDRMVYYDGYGPQREFVLEMPGGTGYQQGQSNAERVINVTWGEDIQPVIDGLYKLVNRESGEVILVSDNPDTNGANVISGNYTGISTQNWNVTPVDSRIGGDFSYWRISPESGNNKFMEVSGFSLENGGNIQLWDKFDTGNQQWYLDYLEEGWFYIRNRESSYCITVNNDGNMVQNEKTNSFNQQWRFLPIDAPIEFNAPVAPTGLTAIANKVSVKLEWTANAESDLASYIILRADTAGGNYNTIARSVTTTAFIDNTVDAGNTYYYKIMAEDHSLNRSDFSNEVSATPTGEQDLVAHYTFEGTTKDATVNLNHSAAFGEVSYVEGKSTLNAVKLNGSDNFIQLPATIANHQEITIATWVYRQDSGKDRRIFDFGNNEDESIYLSPSNASSRLYFGLKNNGSEQSLSSSELPAGQWSHVAITLSNDNAVLYVNGQMVDESTSISISPNDFKPILNYIGRGQHSSIPFNGRIEDFRIYNYSLSAEKIAELAKIEINFLVSSKGETCLNKNNGEITIVADVEANHIVTVNSESYDFTNKKLVIKDLAPGTYDVCLISQVDDFEQCYIVEILASSPITGKFSNSGNKIHVEVSSGTAPYLVKVNGNKQLETFEKDFNVTVKNGDLLEVSSVNECEGKLTKSITSLAAVKVFPNPFQGSCEVLVQSDAEFVELSVYNVSSALVSRANYKLVNGKAILNLENQAAGVYFVRVSAHPQEIILIIKK